MATERHVITNLFGALEVLAGELSMRVSRGKNTAGFLNLRKSGKEVEGNYAILDNLKATQ
jgi:hypothetical protein